MGYSKEVLKEKIIEITSGIFWVVLIFIVSINLYECTHNLFFGCILYFNVGFAFVNSPKLLELIELLISYVIKTFSGTN